MQGMFRRAYAFNQDISLWTTSAVTTMYQMFYEATAFNQDIDGWDVSAVTSMWDMFYNAAAFDQDLSGWDVGAVTTMRDMFRNVTLSTVNYDAILIGWEGLSPALQDNVLFSAGRSKYTAGGAAATARANLITNHSWTITDDGTA